MKFVAHRGYSKRYLENTLPAFEAVLSHPQHGKNLVGIETDIHFTADNRILVLHDTVVVHGDTKIPVCQQTFAEVQRWFRHNHGDKHSIPELHDVLQLVDHKTELNLEIKNAKYNLDAFFGKLLPQLEAYNPRYDITFSCFSAEILDYVKKRTAHLQLRFGFLFDTWNVWEGMSESMSGWLDYIHPKYSLFLEDQGRLRDIELPVQTWTVDDPATVDRLLNLTGSEKIRTIMTNDIKLSERYGEL